MFKSTRRPILIPQSEHLKLAGTLAYLWGNAAFEQPPLPHLSVTAGIAQHDRAYGYLDNLPVGGLDDETWLALTRRGFFMPCSDPVTDLVVRHHLLRLVSGRSTPARDQLAAEMRTAIERQLGENGLAPELLEQVDRMTRFCDNVSLHFCREDVLEGEELVHARYGEPPISIHYRVEGSQIGIAPWPLSVSGQHGYVVGYHLQGYPEQPESLLVPFHIYAL